MDNDKIIEVADELTDISLECKLNPVEMVAAASMLQSAVIRMSREVYGDELADGLKAASISSLEDINKQE